MPLPDRREVSVSYEHLLKLEDKHGLSHAYLPEGADREYTVGELLEGVRWDARVGKLYSGDFGLDDRDRARLERSLLAQRQSAASVDETSQARQTIGAIANWPKFSVACGAVAVVIAIVLWLISSNEWRAIVGGFVGVFLLVTGIVLSLNPVNFYRRTLCYLIPAGVLIAAAGFSFDVWFRDDPTTTGIHWDSATSNGFFAAWAFVIVALIAADCWTRRERT